MPTMPTTPTLPSMKKRASKAGKLLALLALSALLALRNLGRKLVVVADRLHKICQQKNRLLYVREINHLHR